MLLNKILRLCVPECNHGGAAVWKELKHLKYFNPFFLPLYCFSCVLVFLTVKTWVLWIYFAMTGPLECISFPVTMLFHCFIIISFVTRIYHGFFFLWRDANLKRDRSSTKVCIIMHHCTTAQLKNQSHFGFT